MLVPPVSLTQILEGRDGRRYEISADAGGIVAAIHRLDSSLRVYFNEGGMFFVVAQEVTKPGGRVEEVPIMRVPAGEWDGRVLKDLEVRAHEVRNGISAADRLERLEAQARREQDRAFEEEVGAGAYDLMRAIQRDVFNSNPRVFIPSRQRRAPVPVAA